MIFLKKKSVDTNNRTCKIIKKKPIDNGFITSYRISYKVTIIQIL